MCILDTVGYNCISYLYTQTQPVMNQPQRKNVMRDWTGWVGWGSWSVPVSALLTRLNTPIRYLKTENDPETSRVRS